jgi:hypothetical protein
MARSAPALTVQSQTDTAIWGISECNSPGTSDTYRYLPAGNFGDGLDKCPKSTTLIF